MVKQSLSSTTSLTGSNSAGFAPPDEKLILQAAERAFADNATGVAMSGSAMQRLSYAVQCEHAAMVANDDKLASLAMSPIGSEAFKLLNGKMTQFFIGKAPKLVGDDKSAHGRSTRSAKVTLLGRAMKLAVTLAAHGVTFASFNDKTGVYTVPCTMLYNSKKDERPRGRLAANKTVPLDNNPAAIERPDAKAEPRLTPIRASVAQLLLSCNPRANRDNERDDEGVEAMVKNLRDVLLADGDDNEPVHFTAYPEATWNYLAEIAAWYDAAVASPAFKADLSKKKAA